MQSMSLFIYTETSLHAGTGSTVSVVDLPIQRERTTNYPMVQGSGIKGALRSQANLSDDDKAILFGPDTQSLQKRSNKDSFAGAINVGDARIVLFPIRSLMGVFAYATCSHVLARLKRDASGFGLDIPSPANSESALVTTRTALKAGDSVVLEEFSFKAAPDGKVDAIAQWLATHALPQGDEYAYWREKLLTSLVILPDDAFKDFVTTSTEIVTRVRLDSATKTVAEGALWTQEALPADTLLMSSIIISARREDVTPQAVAQSFAPRIQIGGDETTGDGFVALKWL